MKPHRRSFHSSPGALERLIGPWLAPIGLVAIWEGLSRAGAIPGNLMPSPLAVVLATVEAVRHGELLTHLGVSALRAFGGLAIGSSIGIALGLAVGLSRTTQLLLDSPLQMLRAVPALALVPLVILWLGLGEAAKLFIVAVTVVFPLYLNTLHGVRSVDPQLMEMGRVYGLERAALYREIVLPGALPSILVGLRFALGLSWLVLIIAEHIGATRGLGYVAMNAREFMQMDLLVMTIALWAVLGKLADVLARRLERWLLPWQPKVQRLEVA